MKREQIHVNLEMPEGTRERLGKIGVRLTPMLSNRQLIARYVDEGMERDEKKLEKEQDK